ncbi:MAG TPA: MAPEG family protein [Casimicrobiaceae bacterium]|nr:MAPEG family protein [Casimicrobiaceae bacterium]
MIARHAILFPLLAYVLLTAIVALLMYRRRVGEMRTRRIHPQQVASAAQMATRLEDTGAADNFRNLFETPLLFVAAVLTIYAAPLTSVPYVVLAWLYVVTRVVHSIIHCTYNKVMHRLQAFVASLVVVWVMWAMLAYELVIAGKG